MSARIKILTIIYIFIFAGIIVLADLRGTRYLLKFIGDIPYGDKIGHFLLIGALSFLINLALGAKTIRLWRFRYLLGSLIVLVVITIEEISQIFIRGRTFDWGDLICDFAGIFVFGEAARLLARKISKN